MMKVAFILLTFIPISLLGVSTVEASLSDLDNTKPTNPIDPKTDSPTEESGKEGTTTNDLGKPEAEPQTRDETDTETSGGNNAMTSENDPNLKVKPIINCDLNYSPTCIGTQMSDTILGGKNPDLIEGRAGNDWINASGGNDFVHESSSESSSDDDIIYGDKGNDILNGGDGSDKIFGGLGMDEIRGGPGNDRIVGGVSMESSDYSADYIDCGPGNDEIWISLGDSQNGCEKVNVNYPH